MKFSQLIDINQVTERMLGSTIKDQDFMKYGFPFEIRWENKFPGVEEGSISYFKVYLSTYPGGETLVRCRGVGRG